MKTLVEIIDHSNFFKCIIFSILACFFRLVFSGVLGLYLYKMAACSNLLSMKFDENEDYEIN
jgi:hypothetical protein